MTTHPFLSKSGRTYQIEVDDCLLSVSADGVDCGHISLDRVEGMPEKWHATQLSHR